eukprot:scaffold1189_cov315-Prasinococcus_capsulatus_cf.AAC.2
MDPLVWSPESPECFDFPTLLPDPLPGGNRRALLWMLVPGMDGQSIFDGYFDDENFDLAHAAGGVLSMYNNGKPNTNGSQFVISMGADKELDGKCVAFGQVVEGFGLCLALLSLAQLDEYDGTTKQRITVDQCGVLVDGDSTAGRSSGDALAPSALPARVREDHHRHQTAGTSRSRMASPSSAFIGRSRAHLGRRTAGCSPRKGAHALAKQSTCMLPRMPASQLRAAPPASWRRDFDQCAAPASTRPAVASALDGRRAPWRRQGAQSVSAHCGTASTAGRCPCHRPLAAPQTSHRQSLTDRAASRGLSDATK